MTKLEHLQKVCKSNDVYKIAGALREFLGCGPRPCSGCVCRDKCFYYENCVRAIVEYLGLPVEEKHKNC